MITFVKESSVPEHVFERLYDLSVDYIDNGTYPWHLYPPMTAEERKVHMRKQYEMLATARRGVIWLVMLDELPVMLNAGFREKALLRWHLGLVSPDANGSRAWLYDPAYTAARDAFFEELGVGGYIMARSSENQSIHRHVESRQAVNEISSEVEVRATETPGLVDIILRPKRKEGAQ